MDLGTIVLFILGALVSVAIGWGIYVFSTGEWLWDKEKNKDKRNWGPPR